MNRNIVQSTDYARLSAEDVVQLLLPHDDGAKINVDYDNEAGTARWAIDTSAKLVNADGDEVVLEGNSLDAIGQRVSLALANIKLGQVTSRDNTARFIIGKKRFAFRNGGLEDSTEQDATDAKEKEEREKAAKESDAARAEYQADRLRKFSPTARKAERLEEQAATIRQQQESDESNESGRKTKFKGVTGTAASTGPKAGENA